MRLIYKFAILLGLFIASSVSALAQSTCPYIAYGAVLTAAQFQQCFTAKADATNAPYLPLAGGTMQGLLTTAAPTTALAGFNLPPGVAPTSPNNGDIWTTLDGIYVQVNGVTYQLATTVGGSTITAGSTATSGFSTNRLISSGSNLATDSGIAASGGVISTGTWQGSAVAVGYGGTGQTSLTAGAILLGNGSSAIGQLADVSTGALLASAGSGTNPSYCTACTLTTSLTVPTVYGQTTASGQLVLKATSNGSPSGDTVLLEGGILRVTTGSLSAIFDCNYTSGSNCTFNEPISLPASGLLLAGSDAGVTTFTSANSGASNYTITIPAVTDTMAGIAAVQTLTNKVYSGGQWTGIISGTPTLSGANFIALSNIAQLASVSLLGNPTGSTANMEGITLGSTLNFSGTTLNCTSATASQFGCVEPDNSTITINGSGKLTASGSTGVSYVNGLYGSLTLVGSPGGPIGVQSSGTTLSLTDNGRGGFLNRIRNASMNVAQRGASSLSTSITVATYTIDGWIVYPKGAALTCSRSAVGAAGPPFAFNALACAGATSNTDLIYGQRIESYDAVPLGGQHTTIQFWYYQNSGSAQTPQLTTCIPSSADTYQLGTSGKTDCNNNTNVAVDLATTNTGWTSCPSATWCQYGWSYVAGANAALRGFEVDIDCHFAVVSGTLCAISAVDVRADPQNPTVGNDPYFPPFEARPVQADLAWCQRYLYVPPVVAGTNFAFGASAGSTGAFGIIQFPVQMRTAPNASVSSGTGFTVYNTSTASSIASTAASATTTTQYSQLNITTASGTTAGAGAAIGYAGSSPATLTYSAEF